MKGATRVARKTESEDDLRALAGAWGVSWVSPLVRVSEARRGGNEENMQKCRLR